VDLEPPFAETLAYCVGGAEKPGRLPVVPAPMGQRREAHEHVRNSQKRGCEAGVFDHLSIFHISGLALPIGGR
jgi:hypothetical protein